MSDLSCIVVQRRGTLDPYGIGRASDQSAKGLSVDANVSSLLAWLQLVTRVEGVHHVSVSNERSAVDRG